MNYYVTLFDKNYLPHGLSLYNSMVKFCSPFKLIILCIDDETFEVLQLLKLNYAQLLKLSDLETNQLKEVKKTRTRVEYCWTLTPISIRFAFEANPSIEQVTYIDADIWFMKNPQPIFDELKKSKKDVLITRHGFASEYIRENIAGEYCVQFLPFKKAAEEIRNEWEKDCINWCFNRIEDNKFGDQKYLEKWPIKYSLQVHVSANDKWFLAPWNAIRFHHEEGIIWHFHAAKMIINGRLKFIGLKCFSYKIPNDTKKFVYQKYFYSLQESVGLLEKLNYKAINNCQISFRNFIEEFIKKLLNKNFNFVIK